MGYANWRTPRKPGSIGDKLMQEFQFTLDAAASHVNAMVGRYCTLEGKFERSCVKADGCKNCLTAGECIDYTSVRIAKYDGLDPKAWEGENVFCNPPYVGNTLIDWVDMGNGHYANKSALLLPPSIDTAWFHAMFPEQGTVASVRETDDYHSIVFYYPLKGNEPLQIEREIRFYKGRVHFERPAHGFYVMPDGTVVGNEMFDDVDDEATWVWDENDPESVDGGAPRAGNIVLVHYAKGHGPGQVLRKK